VAEHAAAALYLISYTRPRGLNIPRLLLLSGRRRGRRLRLLLPGHRHARDPPGDRPGEVRGPGRGARRAAARLW